MAFVNKWAALQELENVPVSCSTCGVQTELHSPDEAVRHALHDASYIQSFKKEIVLLQRTQALFDRFPESRHPIKVNHEHVEKAERTQVQADTDFDRALADDAELRHFLMRSSFLLPARLAGVSKACDEWQQRLDDSLIRCNACQYGHYVIDAALFERLM